jgi:drug/metabolite transporter (DMT)-like permease
MPLDALGLALAAAVVHAVWNLLLARAPHPDAALAIGLASAVVLFAPVAAVTWHVDAAAWPYVAGSAAFELAYFALLAAAYRRSELSLVYPLARGVAPVLVLAVAALALGASTSWRQGAGVCVVGVGVVLVRGLRGEADARGVTMALAIAGCIAGYTLVDNTGITHAGEISYLEAVLAPITLVYLVGVGIGRGRAALRRELRPITMLGGAAVFGGYLLVLAALRLAPAAPVAAVRETSVLIVTGLAAAVLKERVGLARAFGAALVVAGIVLLGV